MRPLLPGFLLAAIMVAGSRRGKVEKVDPGDVSPPSVTVTVARPR
jgi:hypothetical protein